MENYRTRRTEAQRIQASDSKGVMLSPLKSLVAPTASLLREWNRILPDEALRGGCFKINKMYVCDKRMY